MIKKWSAEHDQELHPKAKFLVTAKAYIYLCTAFGPNISDFFDLCLHWVSEVLELKCGETSFSGDDNNEVSVLNSVTNSSFSKNFLT